MDDMNLGFFQECLWKTQNICSWTLNGEMQVLFSNCPDQDLYYALFSTSGCHSAIRKHFSASTVPLVSADRAGFVWIAVLRQDAEEDRSGELHLLGPVFTSRITEQYMAERLRRLHFPDRISEGLWARVRDIPEITHDVAARCAAMLHFCVNGQAISPTETEVWNEAVQKAEDVEWGSSDWHGDWAAEQRFLKSISEGRTMDLRTITTGNIGNFGGGDPLRQAKNGLIVLAVLCSRAAIRGGVSVEGALGISDYFISRAEQADSISEVSSLNLEMYHIYIQRVRKARENENCSPLVRACAEYVESHIFERIQLKDMASKIGYTESYIIRKFRQETGESLFDFINRQKMELAMVLLREAGVSVAERSDRFSFASPSYFSSVFRKYTGMIPTEYQKAESGTPGSG